MPRARNTKQHSHHVENEPESVHQLLKSRGYRLTSARRDVIGVFVRARAPLTIQEVVSRVPSTDSATVYRILHMLVAEGVVHDVRIPEQPARYEFVRHHHHHIVCVKCGRVEHIPCRFVDTRTVLKESSFAEITDHDVLFSGRCGQCV